MRVNRRTTLGFLFAFILGVVGVTLAQLPNYPASLPQSIQSRVWGYLFGGTWRPAGNGTTALGLFRLAATIQPANATGQQKVYGLDSSNTFAISGVSVSIGELANAHFSYPTVVHGSVAPASSITNVANVVIDAPGTVGTNNFGYWSKGQVRQDGDVYLNGNNVGIATTSNLTLTANTWGTSPAVQGNQYAWQINVGTGATATSGILKFGTAFTHIPSCWVTGGQAQTAALSVTPRITSAAVDSIKIAVDLSIPWPSATTLYGGCFGF